MAEEVPEFDARGWTPVPQDWLPRNLGGKQTVEKVSEDQTRLWRNAAQEFLRQLQPELDDRAEQDLADMSMPAPNEPAILENLSDLRRLSEICRVIHNFYHRSGSAEALIEASNWFDQLAELLTTKGYGRSCATRCCYFVSLKIRETLAAAAPSDRGYVRAVGVSHNKLGDLANANGNEAYARMHYERALQLMEELSQLQ